MHCKNQGEKKACVNFKGLLSTALISMDRYRVASRTCCPTLNVIESFNDVALNNQNMEMHF